MASTYSSSLRLELIGNGEQSGTWGTTTNINLGTLLEQAITGVQTITMVNANYTLTSLNGTTDEARNAVLVVGGTNSAVRNIIAPAKNKLYVIRNNTAGGYDIRIKTAASTGVLIPSNITTIVYCDGSEFYYATPAATATNTPTTLVLRDASGNFAAGTITANLDGNLTATAPTAPTAAPGTNTTQIATTAYTTAAITAATGSLGTMSTQNASSVAITGGTIAGITDLAVADGGTGSSTLAANAVLLGNGTSAVQTVAPGASGNILTSNGTTWASAAAPTGITPTSGSAPYYAARAWVTFDGTTTPPTIKASANVSSVARPSTGSFTINFTTAMPNANYAVVANSISNGGTYGYFMWGSPTSTSACTVTAVAVTSNVGNPTFVSVVVFA